MKRDIDTYLNEAISRSGASSDRRLSEMLGKGANAVNFYRTKKALPNDDTMMDIARLAGIDPFIALLDLNTWRTQGDTQKTYKRLLAKVTETATIMIIMVILSVPFSGKAQAYNADQIHHKHYVNDTLSH